MIKPLIIHLIMIFLLVTRLISCKADPAIARPPSTFTDGDLIGTWTNTRIEGITDTLAIRADHTFRQSYATEPDARLTDVEGTWQLEYRPSGCIYMHLEGMRYIYAATYIMNNGNRFLDGAPLPFREACEDTTIRMPDKVILSVGNDPRVPHGIVLRFPFSSADSGDNYLGLVPTPSPMK